MIEIIYKQNEVIKIQSDAIRELFEILCQHIGAEEANNLQCVKKLDKAEAMKGEIEAEI